MANYENNININLGFNMNNIITLTQYSTGNVFRFHIDDYTVPDNADVNIYVKKPSGHECLIECIHENNLIIAPCTIQMVAELGESNGQIQIHADGKFLYSFKFTLKVIENIYASMRIESSDEYRKLEELITAASYIIEEVNKQEAQRVIDEDERQSNEETRKSNENSRISNEDTRVANEEQRKRNELERQSNEDTRKNNETTRQTNENKRISNENTRISNESGRASTFQSWANAIAGYVKFEERITHLENPDKSYVPLNSNEIVRGTYDKSTDTYIRGCKMEYDPSIEGLVISFI